MLTGNVIILTDNFRNVLMNTYQLFEGNIIKQMIYYGGAQLILTLQWHKKKINYESSLRLSFQWVETLTFFFDAGTIFKNTVNDPFSILLDDNHVDFWYLRGKLKECGSGEIDNQYQGCKDRAFSGHLSIAKESIIFRDKLKL